MSRTKPAMAFHPDQQFTFEKERYYLLAMSPSGIRLQHQEQPSRALFLTNEQITEGLANGTLRAEYPPP
ncbi:hypothetical protein EHH54_03120 [Rhizobium leguminosarum]|uniref:hypothetical protein n=1 Tax=Rhizobium TaxID=379 RepID=UPI000FEC861E|nr:hypothetical protein [Rhizobium leguminosarum]MDH6270169.1 hypothetical protein [Rhizobium leguminosarum]RWX21038.1 hypothetical protein EHH54_40415 [Rhizobium leguminosarum]RWX42314.1 hypothetical protein EHH54_03120 [Rhizobium leguminosarum]